MGEAFFSAFESLFIWWPGTMATPLTSALGSLARSVPLSRALSSNRAVVARVRKVAAVRAATAEE